MNVSVGRSLLSRKASPIPELVAILVRPFSPDSLDVSAHRTFPHRSPWEPRRESCSACKPRGGGIQFY